MTDEQRDVRYPSERHAAMRRALCQYFGVANFEAALAAAYRAHHHIGDRPLSDWEADEIENDARRCSATRAGVPSYIETAVAHLQL